MVRARRTTITNFPEWCWHFDDSEWSGPSPLHRWLDWATAVAGAADSDNRSKRYRLDWLRIRRNVRRSGSFLVGAEPDDLDRAIVRQGLRLLQTAEEAEREERARLNRELFPRGWGENDKTKELMKQMQRESADQSRRALS